jgi:hypothetical protein
MGDAGYVVNGIACALIIFFNIFFCFPYAYPVEPISAMNCESRQLTGVCTELIDDRERGNFGGRVFANSTVVVCTLAGTLRRTEVD